MRLTDYEIRDFKQNAIPDDLLERAIEWISAELHPSDVFCAADLEDWAEDNGYIKADPS